ncbi:MAG: hypothetical protein MN733_04265, partial [Nitrososphaera sp.]|nr:hypothetical protein [Nitrososphaera sp.]
MDSYLSPDPNRFFGYLSVQARADLQAIMAFSPAEASGSSKPPSARSDCILLPEPFSREVKELLGNPNPVIRIAALSDLRKSQDAGTCIELCVRLAFEDPDSRTRGAALITLLMLWHTNGLTDKLENSMDQFLENRFKVKHPSKLGDRLSRIWLSSLDFQRECVANERWARDVRTKYLTSLMGRRTPPGEADQTGMWKLLKCPDPHQRTAALLCLKQYERSMRFQSMCEHLVSDDPDIGVRITAVRCLVTLNAKTKNIHMLRLMAQLVLDEPSSNHNLRQVAYQGIFEIADSPVMSW